jgi:hypothetical protein
LFVETAHRNSLPDILYRKNGFSITHLTLSGKILIVPKNKRVQKKEYKGITMSISSVVPMLSQIMGTNQSAVTQQIQQLLNTVNTDKAVNVAANRAAADTLTLSPAALSLQQLLDAEMTNGGQNGSPADGESGLTGLAQLKSQGDLAAALLKAKMQNFNANLNGANLNNSGSTAAASGEKTHTVNIHSKYAQQYAGQSVLHSADVRFVRHIIEGKCQPHC